MTETSSQIQTYELPKIPSNPEAILALFVMGIIGVMLIPMPSVMLDFLIALNITLSVTTLLVSLYISEPLRFSVFPTLLLLLTLFRLSLNVASTRLILLHGNEGSSAAGRVIESFGQFVVGGNFVVGGVIFLVLIAIQYVVINHGAVRVSEVTARFTLDAMPGKQMSIDADLNTGVIDDQEARKGREHIAKEAEFYGSMDGAVRFTQRDAVAAIIITLINILAGFAIGVLQQGVPMAEAFVTYTILTIGDGLVSTIPSLMISVTAAIMTTRAASESNLGGEVGQQLFGDSRPIAAAAGLLLLMALVPGLPFMAFFFLSAAAGSIAWFARRQEAVVAEPVEMVEAGENQELAQEEQIGSLMRVDPLGLELGYQLIQLVDNKQGSHFLSKVRSIRHQLALDYGVIIPRVHITDNLQLKPKEYRILLKGAEVARSELMPGAVMAINPGQATGEIDGVSTQEPTFNLPALWIQPEQRERAQLEGYTVVDNTTVMATHLTEVIKTSIHQLLGRQELATLIDTVNETHPKVVEELIPKVLSVGQVQKVLQNLLRERASVRDIVTILETLADYAPLTKNVTLLTEYVRQSLGRSICQSHLNEQGELKVFTLSPDLEKIFTDAVTVTEQHSYLALDPEVAGPILERMKNTIEQSTFEGYPVLLTATGIRLHVKQFSEHLMPTLVVLSHNEIPLHVKVISIGEVE